MRQNVELDVLLELTFGCVVNDSDKTRWQGKCTSMSEAIEATFRSWAPEVPRVGVESGPLAGLALARAQEAGGAVKSPNQSWI